MINLSSMRQNTTCLSKILADYALFSIVEFLSNLRPEIDFGMSLKQSYQECTMLAFEPAERLKYELTSFCSLIFLYSQI